MSIDYNIEVHVTFRPTAKTNKYVGNLIDWDLLSLSFTLWAKTCLPKFNASYRKNKHCTITIQMCDDGSEYGWADTIYVGYPSYYGLRKSREYFISNILHEFAHWYQYRILRVPYDKLVARSSTYAEYRALPGEKHADKCERHARYILETYDRFNRLKSVEYKD